MTATVADGLGTPRSSPEPPVGFRRGTPVLTVGGVPVDLLSARAGSTPFFAYDRSLVADRVAELRAALPPSVAVSYAVKANPMAALVGHVAGLVDGLDVASAAELRTALDVGCDPTRIGFAGPGKTDAELRSAVAAGVLIELESAGELRRAVAAGEQLGCTPRVALRINPPFATHGAGVRLGGGPAPFGVDSEQAPQLLAAIGASGVRFEGFHVFTGSQNLDADSLVAALRSTVSLVVELAAYAPGPVRHLNLGGGFGIPYSVRDRRLRLDVVGAALGGLVDARLRPELPDARVGVELGRYLVGEAGVYLSRVVDRKVSRGRTYLVLDGGMQHQLAASGQLGQAIRRNYPVAVATRWDSPAEETVDVVGCLCTSLDLLGRDVRLPRADVGDLIAVFQAGAYGRSASPTDFLSHPAPVELLV